MTIPTPSSADQPGSPPVGSLVGGVVSGGAFELAPPPVPPHPPLANLSTRYWAYLIDNLLVATVAVLALAVAHALGVPGKEANELVWFNLIYATWMFANFLFIGYTAMLHAITGQTIGKRVMGIGVIRADGAPLDFWRSLLRTFGYYLSSFLYVGFLMAFFGQERKALHDYLADTVVVEIA